MLAVLRRSWLPLLVVVLGGAGIAVINTAVKRLVSRSRPPQLTAVLDEVSAPPIAYPERF